MTYLALYVSISENTLSENFEKLEINTWNFGMCDAQSERQAVIGLV